MQAIDILIVSYHRKDFTERTLDSIYERTTTPHRVILVDNGSNNEMQQMLKNYHQGGKIDVLVLLDRNYGLEYAKNTGLRFVHSEPYFVNTDNDLLIEAPKDGKDWLERLVELMNRHADYGAVSVRPQVLIGVPNLFTKDREIGQFYVCGGSYRIMRTEPVKRIRWRDEWNDSRSEEWRICGELQKEGLKTGYARDIRCYHLFGDANWGYKQEVQHYHVQRDHNPKDIPFDPITCIPLGEQYELLDKFEDRTF